MPTRTRVAIGSGTFNPSKMVKKRGSMNVMKKITMPMPTLATTAG